MQLQLRVAVAILAQSKEVLLRNSRILSSPGCSGCAKYTEPDQRPGGKTPVMLIFKCVKCQEQATACSYLLGDTAAQSLCMKAKGWRRSPATGNWCCDVCRLMEFPEDTILPRADTLRLHCTQHLEFTLQKWNAYHGSSGSPGCSSPGVAPAPSTTRLQPPPPPPPSSHFPSQSSAHAPPPPPPPPRSPPPPTSGIISKQCRERLCQASFVKCAVCVSVEQSFGMVPIITPDIAEESPLAQKLIALCNNLNASPATAFPTWVLSPTMGAAQQAQHVSTSLWDDCGNRGGSALMLILLRPLVFGMPWVAPLRIFGVPPPAPLLDLDGPGPAARQPHDNHRTNCVEGLLGHFRQVGDIALGDLLQDCWLLMQSYIAQQQWGDLPAWQIARLSLNLQPSPQAIVWV